MMKKDYQKPEIELISLVAREAVTDEEDDGIMDGEMGFESSDF